MTCLETKIIPTFLCTVVVGYWNDSSYTSNNGFMTFFFFLMNAFYFLLSRKYWIFTRETILAWICLCAKREEAPEVQGALNMCSLMSLKIFLTLNIQALKLRDTICSLYFPSTLYIYLNLCCVAWHVNP